MQVPAEEFPRRIPAPKTTADLQAILDKNEPVIFTDLASNWKAFTDWESPDKLAELAGTAQGDVAIQPRAGGVRGAYTIESMTLKELLVRLRGPEGTHSAYLAGDNLDNFPSLHQFIWPLPIGNIVPKEDLASLGLWMGRDGQVTNCHFDCVHNMLTMIYGEKEFTVAPPTAFLHMYPHTFATCGGNDQKGEIYRFSQIDVKNPDFKQFPNFKKVQLRTFRVSRGETLLLPLGWWHHVRSSGGINVAVNIFFNASNEYWARREYRPIQEGFRTSYNRP